MVVNNNSVPERSRGVLEYRVKTNKNSGLRSDFARLNKYAEFRVGTALPKFPSLEGWEPPGNCESSQQFQARTTRHGGRGWKPSPRTGSAS